MGLLRTWGLGVFVFVRLCQLCVSVFMFARVFARVSSCLLSFFVTMLVSFALRLLLCAFVSYYALFAFAALC